jgi:hypothetical protein
VFTAADCENAQVTWRSQEVQDKGGAAEKEEDKWQAAHNAAAHCGDAMEGEGQDAQRSIFQNEFIVRMLSTTANALLPTANSTWHSQTNLSNPDVILLLHFPCPGPLDFQKHLVVHYVLIMAILLCTSTILSICQLARARCGVITRT